MLKMMGAYFVMRNNTIGDGSLKTREHGILYELKLHVRTYT